MATSPTKEQVRERVTEAITGFGPERDQIVPEATWGQLGLDSLHFVELAEIASEDYGMELKGEEFDEINTVGDAIEIIFQRAQQVGSPE